MENHLTQQHCVPCEGGTAPLTETEETNYLTAVPNWKIVRTGVHKIQREITLKNFIAAVELINHIAKIAESEGHHPNLHLHDFKKLRVVLYTHAIGGLSTNDFIMAAKIDELLSKP